MLKILDLGRDLSCLQAGLAESPPFHEVVGLGVKDANLLLYLSQLIADGMVVLDLSQDAPVVQASDLFPEYIMLGQRPHKQGLEPPL